MILKNIKVPKTALKDRSLEEIDLRNLGKIIVLAGKNGSGKTRFLNELKFQFESNIFATTRKEEFFTKDNNPDNRFLFTKIHILDSGIEMVIERRPQDHLKKEAILSFIPDPNKLINPSELAGPALKQALERSRQVGISNSNEWALPTMQQIQNNWYEVLAKNSSLSVGDVENYTKQYKDLEETIKLFLNTELGRNRHGEVTLFGLPIGDLKLSNGQKLILQFCMTIYSQARNLKNLIILLDEPENHLHPDATLMLIKKLEEIITDGQIWISTHSIPIIAYFDPISIFYVNECKIKPAGKNPTIVLQSLLGDEENISKLQNFTQLPAQFASINYASECLSTTPAVMTSKTDPQVNQIKDVLLKKNKGKIIKVLDYGAGQGRLVFNLKELDDDIQSGAKFLPTIDYIAYDMFDTYKPICEESIKFAYGFYDKKYFNDTELLLKEHGENSFDIIVLCNVLHEIPPTEWMSLFGNDGIVSKCLTENGDILLVEDQLIPHGEKAYENGFMVMDNPQLELLFNMKHSDYISDETHKGRLKARLISKSYALKVSPESIISATESLRQHSLDKVSELRKAGFSYENGRLHGFWSQQFINSDLNLKDLKALSLK